MPGDFSKAFGAGADFVMAGGTFSGHDESGGKLIIKNGIKFKEFYGMSSAIAMKKYSGKVANYRASEGKYVLIKYKGNVEATLMEILGGVRSTCTYVGAKKLKELSKRTTFIRCIEHHNKIYGDSNSNPNKDYDLNKNDDTKTDNNNENNNSKGNNMTNIINNDDDLKLLCNNWNNINDDIKKAMIKLLNDNIKINNGNH